MKRAGNLMPAIASFSNVAAAFHLAAAGKRHLPAVRRFAANFDSEINALVRALADGTWQPGPYECFTVRDPKLRTIHAAPFRDRVVHHALMLVAGPHFERGAAPHSHACRKGKGNLAAVRMAAGHTRRFRAFLKLDIRRYFDSVPHSVLRAQLRRRFKDGAFLTVLDRIVGSFHHTPGRGLPIGTLTSQYFANFFLDGMDHWMIQQFQAPAVVRYMDDFILWHDEPAMLAHWLEQLRTWLAAERGLTLKGAPRPALCGDGVPFLGYRITPRAVLLGRTARRRFAARLRHSEAEHLAGRLGMSGLQRRADSLLVFTDAARCLSWRRRVLTALQLSS